jgi:hypothetical protein
MDNCSIDESPVKKGLFDRSKRRRILLICKTKYIPPPGWSRIEGFKACNVGAEDFELGVAYMYYPACEEIQASPPAISTEAE